MNKKILAAALSANGHYIDIDANTLYVTTAFSKKTEIYGTPECTKLDDILAMFPDMKVVVQSKGRSNDAITYVMMKKYILCMPDAQNNLAEFARVQKMSHAHRSAYQFVAEWFKEKFPHYGELLVKDKETGEIRWNALEQYVKAQEEAEKQKAKAQEEAAAASVEAHKPELKLMKGSEDAA